MLKSCTAQRVWVQGLDAAFLESEGGEYHFGYCAGFVAGAGNAHMNLNPKVCIPDGVSNDRMIEVYVTYLKWNPEVLDKAAGILFNYAMLEFFACE